MIQKKYEDLALKVMMDFFIFALSGGTVIIAGECFEQGFSATDVQAFTLGVVPLFVFLVLMRKNL